MDENLVGYLLNALELEERRDVERHLRCDPRASERLEQLRLALEPLAADDEPIDPPAGLWERTLGRVEDYQRSNLPQAPVRLLPRASGGRGWWNRADVLVAASILLCLALLIPPSLSYVHQRQNLAVGQNNLRVLYTALGERKAPRADLVSSPGRLLLTDSASWNLESHDGVTAALPTPPDWFANPLLSRTQVGARVAGGDLFVVMPGAGPKVSACGRNILFADGHTAQAARSALPNAAELLFRDDDDGMRKTVWDAVMGASGAQR
jgi:prepilin-type processing-associated H-X9-DG protein